MTKDQALALLTTRTGLKSSYSQGQNACVAVAAVPGWVGVQDTKLDDTARTVVVTAAAFRMLIARVS